MSLKFGFPKDGGRRPNDSFLQIRHLHCGQGCFKALVSHLQACPVDSLLQSVAGKNAKGVRDSGFLRRLADTASDLVHDYVVMGGVAAKEATEANDSVVFSSLRGRPGGRGNFK